MEKNHGWIHHRETEKFAQWGTRVAMYCPGNYRWLLLPQSIAAVRLEPGAAPLRPQQIRPIHPSGGQKAVFLLIALQFGEFRLTLHRRDYAV